MILFIIQRTLKLSLMFLYHLLIHKIIEPHKYLGKYILEFYLEKLLLPRLCFEFEHITFIEQVDFCRPSVNEVSYPKLLKL